HTRDVGKFNFPLGDQCAVGQGRMQAWRWLNSLPRPIVELYKQVAQDPEIVDRIVLQLLTRQVRRRPGAARYVLRPGCVENPYVRRIGNFFSTVGREMKDSRGAALIPIFRSAVEQEYLGLQAGGHLGPQSIPFASGRIGRYFV